MEPVGPASPWPAFALNVSLRQSEQGHLEVRNLSSASEVGVPGWGLLGPWRVGAGNWLPSDPRQVSRALGGQLAGSRQTQPDGLPRAVVGAACWGLSVPSGELTSKINQSQPRAGRGGGHDSGAA